MGKHTKTAPESKAILSILEDKSLKAKGKTKQIGELLNNEIATEDLISIAQAANEKHKAILIEAMEYASKKDPGVIGEKALLFLTDSLQDDAPKVKWESARVIANVAHLHPTFLKKAVKHLLVNAKHEGTVVRWSAAGALSKILLCKTPINKMLAPAVKKILEIENDNGVKKIYQQVLKKIGVDRQSS